MRGQSVLEASLVPPIGSAADGLEVLETHLSKYGAGLKIGWRQLAVPAPDN